MPVSTQMESGGSRNAKDLNPSLTHVRAKKRGGKHTHTKAATTSHIDVNSQLLFAVQQERPRVVRRLLDSTQTDLNINTCNSNSESPLMLACCIENEDARNAIVKLLLKKGVEVNLVDRSGQSALMRAVIRNDIESAFALMDSNANVGLVDYDGNNALCYAAMNGNQDMIQRLIREFKSHRLDVDKKNIRGLTPLLIACQAGYIECARALVCEGGASPKIRDLDNFMTAEEWMRSSGVSCSSPELTFLLPAAQKRNYYRKQRRLKGLKTLSDYPLPQQDCQSSPHSFYAYRESERDGPRRHRKKTTTLPEIPDTSPPQVQSFTLTAQTGPTSSSAMKSMFDVPVAKLEAVAPTPGFCLGKPVPMRRMSNPEVPFSMPFSTVQSDLYHSSYMDRRQCYLNRDHRSPFYRRGSLEPLDFNAKERISQLQARRSREEQASHEGSTTRHNALPPLKRHSFHSKPS